MAERAKDIRITSPNIHIYIKYWYGSMISSAASNIVFILNMVTRTAVMMYQAGMNPA